MPLDWISTRIDGLQPLRIAVKMIEAAVGSGFRTLQGSRVRALTSTKTFPTTYTRLCFFVYDNVGNFVSDQILRVHPLAAHRAIFTRFGQSVSLELSIKEQTLGEIYRWLTRLS
jgi:hypothetical protein